MFVKKIRTQLIYLKEMSVTEILFYLYIFSIVTLSGMAVGNVISKLIGIVLVFYFFVVDIFRNKRKIVIFEQCKPLFVFIIVGVISGFVAKDQIVYLNRFATILQLGMFYVVGYSIIRFYNIKVNNILYLIIFSTIIVFLQGMIFSGTASAHLVDERLYSAQGNANTLANFGAFSFLFLIYLINVRKNKLEKFGVFLLLVFIIIGILETESRKGMVLIPIVVFVFITLQSIHYYTITNNKKLYLFKIFSIILGIISLFIVAIIIITKTQYFERFQQLTMFLKMQSGSNTSAFKNIIDYSTYERRQFIKCGLAMWRDHFWIGVGLDNFRSCINEYWISSRHTYSHNNFVEILSSTGILGGVTYYFIYYTIIKNLFKVLKNDQLSSDERALIHIFLTGMFSLLIAEMVIVSYYKKFFWLLFLIFTAYPNYINNKYLNKHNIN